MARYFGTNIISKDISGLTSSQYAAINSGITSNLVNELETNVVHKSGEETITGLKTIQNNRFNIVQTSVTKGTNPSATTYWAIQANDVSNSATWADTRLGAIAWGLQTDGTCSAELTATRNVAGSSDQSIIQAIIKADGTKYGIAPTPTATNSTGDNYIATTGWVNDPTKSTNVVHRWGTETITGEKTFAGGQVTKFKDNTNTIGTYTADAWSTSNLYFSDSTGARIARLQPSYITGTNILKMGMYASNGNTAEQGITVRSDGYTSAPMQAATNSITSTGIATTGWVNDPTKSTNVVHRSGDEIITGTKTWNKSNNIIIQNNTAMDTTVAPSSTLYGGIQFNDKNGKRMGKIETYNTTTASEGYVKFGINSTRYFDVNGTSTPYYSTLNLYIDDNKVGHCSLPSEVHGTNFYGTATRAKWADLAENYVSDNEYSIGTLIKFGGEKDITIANDKCNGVISDKPGFILDAELEDSQPVALVGKTPIRIIGKVNKHDKVALSEIPGVGRVATEGEKVIARALESSDNDDEKLIMCVTKFNLD